MSKGLSFDELYPGTYLKAGEFHGKPVTLTIKSVAREMLSNGTGGEEAAVVVAFEKTEKLFVMNKTNAVCLRAMWGDDSGEWIGNRVTLHLVKDESGLSESGQCIRVAGSPQLDKPLKFRARLGRKLVTQTLVPTGKGSPSGDSAPVVGEDTGEVFPSDEDAPTAAPQPQDGADSSSATPYASEAASAENGVSDEIAFTRDVSDPEVPSLDAVAAGEAPAATQEAPLAAAPATDGETQPGTDVAAAKAYFEAQRPATTNQSKSKRKATVTPQQLTRLGAQCDQLERLGVDRDEWRLYMMDKEGVCSRTELTKTAATGIIDYLARWIIDIRNPEKDAYDRRHRPVTP